MNKIVLINVLITIIAMAVVLVIIGTDAVPTGHVGIKTRFGAVQNEYIPEGLNCHIPFMESIKIMDCRTQRVDVEGEGASTDLQTVSIYIAVNYRVNHEKAFELYKTVGMNYEDILIKPATQESMKASLAKYTAEELITKRSEVAKALIDNLENKLNEKGIVIESVNIVNLDFSQSYNAAIEKKQVAEQEAKKAEQELQKAKIEAERKVVEAQAEAEALKAQKQEITQDLLELRRIENETKWIEKWDGKLPTTSLSSSIPMINLD